MFLENALDGCLVIMYTAGAPMSMHLARFLSQCRVSSATRMTKTATDGKFHIAGDAVSMHHGWVLYALNSAWRAVYNTLEGNPAAQVLLIERWGFLKKKIDSSNCPHP
ncbi:hypothetical protein A0H81_03217, partial [Grifola frondosa]